MTSRMIKTTQRTVTVALIAGCLAMDGTVEAVDWQGSVGYWNDPANWGGSVPDNTGGWAIGNVQNGGTAIVSNTVPHVSEAWAGNYGGAGVIIVTNGGAFSVDNWLVVARMCCPSPNVTPLSTLIVNGGTVNKGGDGFIVGDSVGTLTGLGGIGELILGGNGKINVTGGWFSLAAGGFSVGTAYFQDNGVYNAPGIDFNLGDWGNGRGTAYVRDNATLNITRVWISKWDNSVGALWQSGGSVNGTGAGGNEWTLGGEGSGSPDAFGFYNLSGGYMNNTFNFQVGRYAKGVMYQTGGTNSQGGWMALGRYPTGLGVGWISGGRFAHVGTGTHLLVAEQGRGELTISDTATADANLSLVMANGGLGLLALNGGTLSVPRIEQWSGQGYFNFNGGILQAKQNEPAFMSGLAEARVYAGNAIIDTAGSDIVIAQPLVAASGQGVSRIPLTSAGSGYMAPPIVQIDGDGFGAMAVAQIDPVAGTVTNILVTCPGHDYGTIYTVTLIGGGGSSPATVGNAVLAPVSSGGLVKNGTGRLTLAGANTYTGPTVVNAGILAITSDTVAPGNYTVADGAGFGVAVRAAGLQANVSGNLSLGTSQGATLDFDLGAFGNPIAAPLVIGGSLTLNGPVTVNIVDGLPQVGQFTLLQFANKAGSGSFVLGSLPVGVQANLITGANSVDLAITAVNLPRWDGQAGGFWDINQTANWADISTGLATRYGDGNAVVFDDNALGTTTVDIVTAVRPASITINNTNLAYTFVGTGKISGAAGLQKSGTNTLTIANAPNDYTGPTVIGGGALLVTNLANGGQPSAIGSSSSAATNLVLAGGRLVYSGKPAAIDRAYLLQQPASGIDVQSELTIGNRATASAGSSFVKGGSGKLIYKTAGANELSGGAWPGLHVAAGTLVFDGSSAYQTNHSQNEMWVAGNPDVGASTTLSNTSLRVDSWLAVGRGNGTAGNFSRVDLYDSRLWTGSFSMGYNNGIVDQRTGQFFTMNGNSTFTNSGDFNLGESGGCYSSLVMSGNSVLYSQNRLFIGWHVNDSSISATGAVTMADSSVMHVNAWLSIGNEGGFGTMLMKNDSSLEVLWDLNITDVDTGDGTFTMQDNAKVGANNVYVAKGVGSTGAFNMYGGTVTTRGGGGNEFQIGVHGPGTWNQTGGTVNANGNWTSIGRYNDGNGVLNISGGSFNHNDPTRLLQVGEAGNGVLNVSGAGVVTTVGSSLYIANAAGSVGLVNLDGGTIFAKRVGGGGGSSTFNFNGGVLFAGPGANLDFMSGLGGAYVLSGGAKIDSSSNTIAISQALLDGGSTGGLTKLGPGALALNGENTYTGSTVVSAGTLGGRGVIRGPFTVAQGATLAPGAPVGTLSVSNTVTLAAGSTTIIEIDKGARTNDLLQGVTILSYGGTLVLTNISGTLAPDDTFKVFSADTYSGAFSSVVSGSATWDTSRLNIDGTVKVISVTVAEPPKISAGVTNGGTQFVVSWPADRIGWRLLVQTNNLVGGVSGAAADWGVVPGSTSTNAVFIPIETAKPTEFYRLQY